MGSSGAAAGSGIFVVIGLVIAVLMVISMWRIFVKAGQPGWAAIIPIYNAYVMCVIAGKPGWWLILFIIPFVNIVIGVLLCLGLAEKFGKSAGFGVGLLLLCLIFFPILAFSDAQYESALAPGQPVTR